MTVHWKRNIFRVPQGNIGKQFVDELARLYAAFADGSALESVSLKAIIVIPSSALTETPPFLQNQRKYPQCEETYGALEGW